MNDNGEAVLSIIGVVYVIIPIIAILSFYGVL